MDVKKQIKAFIHEAELYKSQGLLEEAKKKYISISEFIKKNEQIKGKQSLLNGISKKISALEKEANMLDSAPISAEMSQKMQRFIKSILHEAESYGSQGLISEAKEKYYEAADFIKNDDQLRNKQKLLDGISKKISALEKGTKPEEEKKKPTPPPEIPSKEEIEVSEEEEKEEIEEEEEEFIDISSIGITLDHGPEKGRVVEFDVSFQSGNMINLIISSKDKAMIENLKTGDKLNDIQFYSPIAIFKGSGIVSANKQIDSGPKQGDYRLELKISSS